MIDIQTEIQQRLLQMQDSAYRVFQCRLMPTVEPDSVIGVRTPQLRSYAKELKDRDISPFLTDLPHKYYEENNLHGFLLENIKDYDLLIKNLDEFLPYINNWATCDLISPKVFKKHLPELYEKIKEWIASGQTFTVRFAVEMLMSFYLDGEFKSEYLTLVAGIRSEEYYVNMIKAWYFATALAKQYEATVPFIEQGCLDIWSHNKSIQKAIESYRITDEQKAYLRSLKIK